jgi:hypothetical protein
MFENPSPRLRRLCRQAVKLDQLLTAQLHAAGYDGWFLIQRTNFVLWVSWDMPTDVTDRYTPVGELVPQIPASDIDEVLVDLAHYLTAAGLVFKAGYIYPQQTTPRSAWVVDMRENENVL